MNVKLTAGSWQWDKHKLIAGLNDPVIYKSYQGLIYILFQKPISNKGRHDILCLGDYKRLFDLGDKPTETNYCTFCLCYKPSKKCKISGEWFGVCDNCRFLQVDDGDIYTNDKFEDPVQTVEYILHHNYRYYFFYHIIVKEENFNYPIMIHQPWFQITKEPLCSTCYQENKEYHSWCKNCYHFAYDQFFNHHLCKYDLIKQFELPMDLANVLMNQYLSFYNIDIKCELLGKLVRNESLIPVENGSLIPKNIQLTIVQIEIETSESDELETDLITEDNVSEYLEDDYEDDALGTWSDED